MAKRNTDNKKGRVAHARPQIGGNKTPALPVPDFFATLGNKAPLLLLAILVLICCIIFRGYLLQDKYYLFKSIANDSVNNSYPYYCCVADSIRRYGLPGWSFNFGMGHSLFPFLLQDPFALFMYIAGKEHIMGSLVYKEMAKIILAGMLFFYYLRLLKLSDFTAIIGGILYAFCGFMVIGSFWYIFSFEALNFALLLLSFELLFTRGKWYLFPMPIFFICISQPVNLYVYGIFMALYVVFRLFHTGTFTVRNLGAIYLKMICFGLIGVLLSGPFLLENIFQLVASPRVTGANSYMHTLLSQNPFSVSGKYQFGTSLLRFFSNDMAGTGQYYNGASNYLEVPELYCGLVCLLLMPQVFGFLERKVRIVFIIFISIWFIGLIFPYARYTFWLFSGDYYRAYSFFGAFCFLLFSLIAFDLIIKNQRVNKIILLISMALWFIVLYCPWFPPKEQLLFPDKAGLTTPLYVFVSIVLVAYGGMLFFIGKFKTITYAKYLLFALTVLEVAYLNNITVNNVDEVAAAELTKEHEYNDFQQDAVNYIKQNDASFFRIDKACYSSPAMSFSYNDGMVQDYKGTCAYNSFNQLYYINYLQLMGIADKNNEHDSRWAVGTTLRPALQTENSVKYILTKDFIFPFWRTVCDSINVFGDVKVLRNKYVLPLGYTCHRFIKENLFGKLSNNQKDLVSLRACVMKDDRAAKAARLQEFDIKDTVAVNALSMDTYRAYISDLRRDTMVLKRCDDNHISGTVTVTEAGMMYLSIPYDKGWQLKVDGKRTDKQIVNGGMTGIILSQGAHVIEMGFEPPFLRIGLLLSVLGIIAYVVLFRSKLTIIVR